MEGFLKVKNLFELGTRTLYLPTSVTSFPDLSICPSDPYHMENLIINGIKSIDDYRFKHTWNSNNISKSAKDLYKEVVINVEKIVARIDINLECQYNGSNILTLTSFDSKLCYNQSLFEIKEYYYNGDCLILVIPECLSRLGPLEIALEFNIDVHIFLHHKGKETFVQTLPVAYD